MDDYIAFLFILQKLCIVFNGIDKIIQLCHSFIQCCHVEKNKKQKIFGKKLEDFVHESICFEYAFMSCEIKDACIIGKLLSD